MNSTELLTADQLNELRLGDFALTQELDGSFRVQNIRTGTKTSARFSKGEAIRVRDALVR